MVLTRSIPAAACQWHEQEIYPVNGPRRGRLAVTKAGDLLVILPDALSSAMRILVSRKASGYTKYEEVWSGTGLSGEPLVDVSRLEEDGVLSLFCRMNADEDGTQKSVVIMDFDISNA